MGGPCNSITNIACYPCSCDGCAREQRSTTRKPMQVTEKEEKVNASFHQNGKLQVMALSAAVALALAAGSAQGGITQSKERKNMERLGHTDLQGRPSYMPNVIQYPDGRTIMFAGMHSGVPAG